MKFFSETIFYFGEAADIAFTIAIEAKGINVVQTIRMLLYAADTLLSRLIHKVVLEELMDLPSVSL